MLLFIITALVSGSAASAPASTIVEDTQSMFVDESGQVATAPLIVVQGSVALDTIGLGAKTSPMLLYPTPNGGPLVVEDILGSGTTRDTAADYPVSTGSCDLFNPQVYAIYDRERSPPYAYAGNAGADCAGNVERVYCYAELWRLRDGAMVDNDGDYSNPKWSGQNSCIASAFHGWYRKRNYHYVKGDIVMEAGRGGFWGSGRGPSGWSCSGQGTSTLSCRRNSKTES